MAACSSPLRCEYGFSSTKINAWFEALPLKLKPEIAKIPSTSGMSCQNPLDLLADALSYIQATPPLAPAPQ